MRHRDDVPVVVRDLCYPFTSEIADDFTRGLDTDILAVQWWGVCWCGSPIPPDAFHVNLYADADGVPGESHASTRIESYLEGYDETVGFCVNRYCAHFDEPVPVVAGETMWMGIQAEGCANPPWGYATGDGNTVPARFLSPFFGYDTWTGTEQVFGIGYEAAVQIHGDQALPTAETTWGVMKHLLGK